MPTQDFEFKRSLRARCLRITVALDGRVRLTAPYFVSRRVVDSFARAKWPWVEKARARLAGRPAWEKRKYTKKDYRDNKEAARFLVTSRLTHFQLVFSHLGVELLNWKKISIRDQKSRWGSCSRKGNLNFNYRIVFLPAELQDYIIVHELCHLRELNHSKRFWALVALAVPDYNERRKRLIGKSVKRDNEDIA